MDFFIVGRIQNWSLAQQRHREGGGGCSKGSDEPLFKLDFKN